MNTRVVAVKYRLGYWAKIVSEHIDRGMSIHAYCEDTNIHENTYYYWQRKLREAACLEISERPARQEAGRELAPHGWAKLSVTE